MLGLRSTLILAVLLGASPSESRAAEAQASVDAGLSFFQTAAATGSISPMGYFLHFLVESHTGWVRPNFGAQIEFSSGTNRLINGHMLFGVELIGYKANYVKPFLGVAADLGWANLATATSTYNNYIYGFAASAGAEIRFSSNEGATAIRLTTTYRYLMGTVGGGLAGSDLNTVSGSIGLTF